MITRFMEKRLPFLVLLVLIFSVFGALSSFAVFLRISQDYAPKVSVVPSYLPVESTPIVLTASDSASVSGKVAPLKTEARQ